MQHIINREVIKDMNKYESDLHLNRINENRHNKAFRRFANIFSHLPQSPSFPLYAIFGPYFGLGLFFSVLWSEFCLFNTLPIFILIINRIINKITDC